MTKYCRLMFGITKASPAKIEQAIASYLGIRKKDDLYHMGWELLFITAEKQA